jgi:hypothetical protein
MGWQDDPVVEQTSTPAWMGDPVIGEDTSQDTRSIAEEAARQLGLGSRAVVEGLTSIAALPSDALFGLVNFIQAKRGKEMPFQFASESISAGLTKAGFPQPETPNERVASDVMRSLSGPGAASLGAGRVLTAAGSAAATKIGETLLTRPALQLTGNVSGQLSASATREAGGDQVTQAATGIVGGIAGGNVNTVAGGARRALGGAADVLTEGGRRAIAGQIINTAAANPARAAQTLASSADEIVRGSAPTTGQAAKDAGLAYFENRLRALDASKFSERISSQNEARQALLDTVADGGLPQKVQARIARRETVTQPMRDRAFTQAQGKQVDTDRITAQIEALATNPDNAGDATQQALNLVRKQVEKTVEKFGKDARALYGVRKDINRLLEGRYVGADESVLRYAGSQLKEVRSAIDDAITEVAPSWKQYLTKYAQLSQPIERAETLDEIRKATTLAAPDVATGREFISQPKWKQVVTRNMPELEKTLTKGQIQKVRMIAADLDRGAAAANSASVRVPGSDTVANLATSGQISVAYVVSRVTGGNINGLSPTIGSVARPLSFLAKLPDESIKQLLVDAMLDPKLAHELMDEGTPDNVRRFAESLAESMKASGIGTTAAVAQNIEGQ